MDNQDPPQFLGPSRYREFAKAQRVDEQYEVAGVYYIAASNGWFMKFRNLPDDLPSGDAPSYSTSELGYAAKDLLSGALCFRLANMMERARTYCKSGILHISDILDNEGIGNGEWGHPRIGLLHEIRGDLRLFGGFGTYDEEYANAEKYYKGAESQRGWSAESEFDSLIRLLIKLADGSNYHIDKNTRVKIHHLSLDRRIQYKREHYPDILQHVLENGGWTSVKKV
jgi:hypothetical protein